MLENPHVHLKLPSWCPGQHQLSLCPLVHKLLMTPHYLKAHSGDASKDIRFRFIDLWVTHMWCLLRGRLSPFLLLYPLAWWTPVALQIEAQNLTSSRKPSLTTASPMRSGLTTSCVFYPPALYCRSWLCVCEITSRTSVFCLPLGASQGWGLCF